MSAQLVAARNGRLAARAWPAATLLLALAPLRASAYVVVTTDNQVFEVPTRPEVHADLVTFTLDGLPVALRYHEVNVVKTNELNQLLDRGSAAQAAQAAQGLPEASPADERIIVSSRLHRAMERRGGGQHREARVMRGGSLGPPVTFDGDGGGRGVAPSRGSVAPDSPFASEARDAMAQAEARMEGPAPSAAGAARGGGRLADLDAEIAAEQQYLSQLTAGEVTVDDLDREIARSMDKIKRLQRRRDRLAEAEGMAGRFEDPGDLAPPVRYPAGSREARLDQARERLQRLQAQRDALEPGQSDEREVLDELIGETEHEIQRIERRSR